MHSTLRELQSIIDIALTKEGANPDSPVFFHLGDELSRSNIIDLHTAASVLVEDKVTGEEKVGIAIVFQKDEVFESLRNLLEEEAKSNPELAEMITRAKKEAARQHKEVKFSETSIPDKEIH
jgi:predicted RNA-binding protein